MMGKYLAKIKLRGQLMKTFKMGGICKQIKTSKQTYIRYPTIHEIMIDEEKKAVRFTFTLFNGTNPDLVNNQLWVFRQHFGRNIEFKGDRVKKFIFWVYGAENKNVYKFVYADLVNSTKGLHVPIIAGKDSLGKVHMYDMIKNPHLLVMGETGSGKSVYLRSVITFLSIFMRERIELYLADMKRTEFFIFKDLDNVKCNVTTKEELFFYLGTISKELERRGDLLNKAEVAHIDDYNALESTRNPLPYLVLCIDEVALLKKERPIMDIVEEISCIGRSLGCLLILSMQRADSKLMEGALKSNLTGRNIFRTADKINSDIGLGRKSEEDSSTILMSEKGKSYFKLEKTTLLQAPLLELEEAKALLKPFKVIAKEIPSVLETKPEKPSESSEIAQLTIDGVTYNEQS